MTAKILEGRVIAQEIREQLARKIKLRIKQGMRPPGLAVIFVGQDPASTIYVKNKRNACKEIGMISKAFDLEENISEQELLALITKLNQNASIDGILVQLPLPSHINTKKVLECINPKKDVDGFHPFNVGSLVQGDPCMHPCTPLGIMKLIKATDTNLQGINATIVGASNIVGKPMIFELLLEGATVIVCHKLTKDLPNYVKSADLLIVATGNPNLIQGEWIKPNAIVIDVGINRLANGQVVGDVDFEAAKEQASWITPVPGGVGPMTIAALLENTFKAYLQFN